MDFAIVTPVRTGLCMSTAYVVNKMPRSAVDLVSNSVDHMKDIPCQPMSSNYTESLSTVLHSFNGNRRRERRTWTCLANCISRCTGFARCHMNACLRCRRSTGNEPNPRDLAGSRASHAGMTEVCFHKVLIAQAPQGQEVASSVGSIPILKGELHGRWFHPGAGHEIQPQRDHPALPAEMAAAVVV